MEFDIITITASGALHSCGGHGDSGEPNAMLPVIEKSVQYTVLYGAPCLIINDCAAGLYLLYTFCY